jgi:ribosome-binding factor A
VAGRKKEKLEELLRRELSNIILYELKDPRPGFVTVIGVDLSEDGRSAKVRLTVRGKPQETDLTLRSLDHARGYIQSLIGRRLQLRFTPVLNFVEDKDTLRALRVEKLIDQARREDRQFEP